MTVQTVRAVKWQPLSQPPQPRVSNNKQGSIAICSAGVVESWVDSTNTICLCVGVIDDTGGAVEWGDTITHVGGLTTSIAVNRDYVLVEVHQSSHENGLWCYVGVVDFGDKTINWTYKPDKRYDQGSVPSVALSDNETLILLHQSQDESEGKLYGHLGTLNVEGTKLTLKDLPQKNYDTGNNPRAALNAAGNVVEVHEGSGMDATLYARVGTIDFSKWTVDWQGGIAYDEGALPAVALSNAGELFEVHQSQDPAQRSLWYWRGEPDFANKQLGMQFHECIGWGQAPTVGINSQGVVAFDCVNGDNNSDSNLFYGLGQVGAVTYGFSDELLRLRYNEVIFPGTHNSYCNDGSNPGSVLPYRSLLLNQHLDITQQLDAGIRCLDIEVHPVGDGIPPAAQPAITGDAIVYHGNYPGAALTGCSSLITLFTQIKGWVEVNPKEIVTLFCDYQGGFEDDQTIINVLDETGLLPYVFNKDAQVPQSWPYLKDMITGGKTVMLMGMKIPYTQNFYDAPEDNCANPDHTWNSKVVSDLSPAALCLPNPEAPTGLFRDANFCSRRTPALDAPYIAGGNPYEAGQANQYYVVYGLAQEIMNKRQGGRPPNWVWVDFAGTAATPDYGFPNPFPPYGFLAAIYDLNQMLVTGAASTASDS